LQNKADSLCLLLDHGCSIGNLLSVAVECGSRTVFDLLLSRGAEVNVPGDSTLHKSVYSADEYFIERLISMGVDLSVQNSVGLLAVDEAILKGRYEIAILLLGYGAPTRGIGSNRSAVVSAIERKDVRLCGVVLGAGADPDNEGGRSGLSIAISDGNEQIVRLLLAVGANSDCVEGVSGRIGALFEAWKTEPIRCDGLDDCTDLGLELEKAQMNAAAFLDRGRDSERFAGALSDVLGEVNRMVVLVGRLATTVEQRVRELRERRQKEISNQFVWLSTKKSGLLKGTVTISGESSWRSSQSRALNGLSQIDFSLFPPELSDAIRLYLSSVELLEVHEGETALSDDLLEQVGAEELERRGRLLYLNSLLPECRQWVNAIHNFITALCPRIREVLEVLENTLTEMITLLVMQQQMNTEFEKVHSQASVPSQAAGILQDRKDVLALDRALVSWERVKFNDIYGKLFRLLRYCVV
jgi:hypothetical protein